VLDFVNLAGGAPLDIALVHGVSHCEEFKCICQVIDAINNEPQLGINFPQSHLDQLFIAKQFQAKSRADFTNCVGAIDEMLVWIQKPALLQVKKTGCGEPKFFCGRKKNMGSICRLRVMLIDGPLMYIYTIPVQPVIF
jgi:hypothetical protein